MAASAAFAVRSGGSGRFGRTGTFGEAEFFLKLFEDFMGLGVGDGGLRVKRAAKRLQELLNFLFLLLIVGWVLAAAAAFSASRSCLRGVRGGRLRALRAAALRAGSLRIALRRALGVLGGGGAVGGSAVRGGPGRFLGRFLGRGTHGFRLQPEEGSGQE